MKNCRFSYLKHIVVLIFTYKLHYINTIQKTFAKFCCIEAIFLTPIKIRAYALTNNLHIFEFEKIILTCSAFNSFHVINQQTFNIIEFENNRVQIFAKNTKLLKRQATPKMERYMISQLSLAKSMCTHCSIHKLPIFVI